jgi:hypothetical protein
MPLPLFMSRREEVSLLKNSCMYLSALRSRSNNSSFVVFLSGSLGILGASWATYQFDTDFFNRLMSSR